MTTDATTVEETDESLNEYKRSIAAAYAHSTADRLAHDLANDEDLEGLDEEIGAAIAELETLRAMLAE